MRNQAKLFKTGLAGTQFVLNMEPRKPWNPAGANGGFDNEESPNSLQLSLDGGSLDGMGLGHAPETHAIYFDGVTAFSRAANDAEVTILGDCTVEAIVKLDDIVWPANADVIGMSGPLATDYPWTVGIDSVDRHPKWHHEGTGGGGGYTWDDIRCPSNEWIYLAFVRDDTQKTITFYMNGAAHPFVHTYTNSADAGGGGKLGVGANTHENNNYFQGWMSGVRVRDIAATAAQIAATADRVVPNKGAATKTPDLLPELLPSAHANIRMWHEAGFHDLDDGDQMETPTKLAGAATGLTQVTEGLRPLIYPAAGQVGWKMQDGNGGGSAFYLIGGNDSDYIQLSPSRYHVYVPFIMHSADQFSGTLYQNHRLFGDDAGWFGAYARRTVSAANGDFEIYGYHWDGGAKITPHVVQLGVPHLFEMWYDVANSETVSRVDDGPEVRVAAGAAIGGEGPLHLGGNPTDDFLGVIFGALLANDEDPASRAGIRNYYANKYGMDV